MQGNQQNTTDQVSASLEPLLTRKQAARILGVTDDALARMASENRGPAWVRVGAEKRGAVRYSPAALREYIAEQTRGGRAAQR